jgi:MFS family permease
MCLGSDFSSSIIIEDVSLLQVTIKFFKNKLLCKNMEKFIVFEKLDCSFRCNNSNVLVLLLIFKIASLTTSLFIGVFFGSTFWGSISDNYGRKSALIMANLSLFIFGIN